MPRRRGRSEGAIFQRHTPECPPVVDGERPAHRCKGRWVAEVDLGYVNGKRKRKTIYAPTRKEAAIKLQQALAAKQTNSLVTGRLTTETWLRYWVDVICVERGLKPNTMRSHRHIVENYLIPYLGRHRVDRLEPDHIRAMYAAMTERGLSETTRSHTHAVLRRALAVAVRERKATHNAADLIDRPRALTAKQDALSLPDAKKVLTAAGDNPRWFLALYMGMRQGEVLGLRWSDIDFASGILHIERSLSMAPGGRAVFVPPKTAMSAMPLPLITVVSSRLAVAYAQHLAQGGQPDDLVFRRPDGRPVSPKTDNLAWHALLRQAGVESVPLHSARNTTASLLKALGVPMHVVRAILRHTSITQTEHYAADDLESKRKALAELEAALGD